MESEKLSELDKIIIYCLYKSADIWRRTNIQPELKNDPGRGRILFEFPKTPEIKKALNDHLNNEGGIKSFISYFKTLRSLMYVTPNGEKRNDKP